MSILKKIKKYFFYIALKRKSFDVHHQSAFLCFDEINTIALIYQKNGKQSNWEELLEICLKVQKTGKKIVLYLFCNDTIIPESVLNYHPIIISKNSISCCFIPSQAIQDKIRKMNEDIIIDLTKVSKLTTLYLLMLSNSKMRMGREDEKFHKYFDFLIEWKDKESALEYIDNVIYYLQILKKSPK